MTEDNAHLTLSERDVHDQNGTDYNEEMRRKSVVYSENRARYEKDKAS